MDAVLSFSTLVGAILSYTKNINIEGILGLIIGVFIIKSSIQIFVEAIDLILGSRADGELTKKLKNKINSYSEVQGVYDLNIHNYGPTSTIASVHIQVRNDMTAEEIHIITREIEYEIYKEFGITLTIGIYAANDNGEYGEIKKELINILKDYENVLQFHGFYVDKEDNVYFDIIMDFDVQNKEKIKNEILERIKEKYPKYNYNVILDSDVTD